MKQYLQRHQPQIPVSKAAIAGLGGLIAIGTAGALTGLVGAPLLMAPFGATCVLLFSVPQSPLSQPANVIGGHLVSALIGLALAAFLPDAWWAVGLAVGLAIMAMAVFRVTHPPAGANPLVVFALQPGFEFAIVPVLIGAILMTAIAVVFHRISRTPYPMD